MTKNCVSGLLIASALIVAGPFINNAEAGIVDDVIVDYRLGLYDDAFNRMLHVADDHHPRALFWVGSMYQKGRGTAVDFERANEFYRRAALLGNSDAQNNLGLMYRYGTGVQQDREKAFAWFSIAESNGNRIAADNRDRLGFTRRDSRRDRVQDFILQFRRDIRTYQSSVMKIVRPKADEQSEPVIEQSRPLKSAPPVEPGTQTVEDHATPSRVIPSVTPVQETSFEQTSPEASLGGSSPSSFQLTAAPETMPQTHGRTMKTAATNGAFTVQVGIFAKKQSVQRIHEAAERTGIELYEDQIVISDRSYSRIRHGKFVNITEAKNAADQINGLFKVESLIVRTIN